MVMLIGVWSLTHSLHKPIMKHHFVILTFVAFEKRKETNLNYVEDKEGNGLQNKSFVQKDKLVTSFSNLIFRIISREIRRVFIETNKKLMTTVY